MQTQSALGTAALGGHIYVFAHGLDDQIYVNSAVEGAAFDGWGYGWVARPVPGWCAGRRHARQPDLSVHQGRHEPTPFTSALHGQAFGSWQTLVDLGLFDASPCVTAFDNRLYLFVKGLTVRRLYLTYAKEGEAFRSWIEVQW